MKIYLARNNVQAGPYTLDELNTMLASGEVLLDDLAWHAPMSQWQRLGDLTDNQLHYQPAQAQPVGQSQPAQAQPVGQSQPAAAKEAPRGFGDNVDFKPTATDRPSPQKRISVAELYGKKPADEPNQHLHPTHAAHAGQASKAHPSATLVDQQAALASIGSRFLAVVINFVLFLLTLLPFLQQFMALDPDPERLNLGDMAARMEYARQLATQIPTETMTLSSLLLLGYVLVQMILIIARGQSFGKLLVGIRTVDVETFDKPNFLKRIILRIVVLFVIYQFASALPIPINMALILLMINYFIAGRNPKRQGWHDKLAGTTVVKTSAVPFKKGK
ncbi:RDD family protein [Moraxella sp. RCAD0137]|uniref:RDD family protein n=1 Tax=Moraxella sp. RCAD0137 TaxID=1775913 RepID=UPI000C9F944F|nr:RDD family protein [Moraxella sp. RCAD0137]PNP99075.1 transporter [Moraxella sp. RCAD0137]